MGNKKGSPSAPLLTLNSHQKLNSGFFLAGTGFTVDLFGMQFDVPNEAAPREHFEDIVGHIDFPPIDTLAFGIRIAVMVIMPAFTHGNDRKNEAILALFTRIEPPFTDQMGQRIDAEGAVIKDGGASKEAPAKHLHPIRMKPGSGVLKENTEKEDA